jgi:hypothetical protein
MAYANKRCKGGQLCEGGGDLCVTLDMAKGWYEDIE